MCVRRVDNATAWLLRGERKTDETQTPLRQGTVCGRSSNAPERYCSENSTIVARPTSFQRGTNRIQILQSLGGISVTRSRLVSPYVDKLIVIVANGNPRRERVPQEAAIENCSPKPGADAVRKCPASRQGSTIIASKGYGSIHSPSLSPTLSLGRYVGVSVGSCHAGRRSG